MHRGRQGMRRVFDDEAARRTEHPREVRHRRHLAAIVHGDPSRDLRHPVRLASERALQGRWIHAERLRLHVHEDGRRIEVRDHLRRRGEGERRHDDTLTASDPERRERQVERRGAGADRDRVRGADVARERRLELLHPGPGGEPPRAEHVQDGSDVPVVDFRPKERHVHHESPKR